MSIPWWAWGGTPNPSMTTAATLMDRHRFAYQQMVTGWFCSGSGRMRHI